MPQITVTHSSSANDSLSDQYGMPKNKGKQYTRAYKRVFRTTAGASREIFVMNDNPDYDRFNFLLIHNTGADNAFVRVDSGANSSYHKLPAGKTLQFFSNNVWNNGSATTPDTTDGFYLIGDPLITEATVKVTVFI